MLGFIVVCTTWPVMRIAQKLRALHMRYQFRAIQDDEVSFTLTERAGTQPQTMKGSCKFPSVSERPTTSAGTAKYNGHGVGSACCSHTKNGVREVTFSKENTSNGSD